MKKIFSKVFICFLVFILTINIGVKESYGKDKDVLDYIGDFLVHPILTVEKAVLGESTVNFVESFSEYPVETVGCIVIDVLRAIFGDIPQIFANMICSYTDIIEYTPEMIQTTYLDEYTCIGVYMKNDPNFKYNINEPEEYEDENSFVKEGTPQRRHSKGAPIPIILVDLYNISSGDIDLLDINFLSPKRTQKEKSFWMILRNFSVAIIKSVFFLAMGFYIIMIIYHAIKIITNSLSNPKIRKEHMEGLKRLVVSFVMLIGTILIMALTIYGIQMIFNQLKVTEGSEFPIRVHVQGADYSFSTNLTGYTRYMASTEGAVHVLTKGMYAFIYIVLAIVNLVMVILMILRMIIMLLLAILGPISAVMYSLNIHKPMRYDVWIQAYLKFAIIQIFIIIAYRLFLEMIAN